MPHRPLAIVLSRRRLMGACAAFACAASARAAEDKTSREGLAALEGQRADRRAEMCSAAIATGVGLRGEYFERESFGGATLMVRTDATVDFDAALDWPTNGRAKSPRSVRWTGWIKPPLSGVYLFHADAANSRLVVSGRTIAGRSAPADAHIELAAGRFYPLVLEISRLGKAQARRLRLEWTAPHGARYVVPRPLLYLPTETVAKPRA